MLTKKNFTSIILLLLSVAGSAQQKVITLEDALKSAENNYPAVKQKLLFEEAGKENVKLLNASLYPQLNVAGQATYQSEVTKLEVPGSYGFGQKPNNYFLGVEMRLPLTAFGAVQTRRQLENAQTTLNVSKVDIDIQKVRERVTSLVGLIMFQQENQDIMDVRVKDLDSQRRKVAVGVANGAVLKSNQLVLESEILTTEQRIDDIRATLKGLTSELSLLTGLAIDSATQFQLAILPSNPEAVNRPELKAFAAQKNMLDLQSELVRKESHPDLFVFSQGYYGRPGYNFLNMNLRTYGIAGVGVSWKINNMFTQGKEQKVIDINRQIVNSQEETFSLNLQTALVQKGAEIEKYRDIISKDAQIVKNREQIIRSASSQLENGVITSTEYLTELNGQTSAELNLVLHQVQLAIAKAQYSILLGY